jgi:hypothetical protein
MPDPASIVEAPREEMTGVDEQLEIKTSIVHAEEAGSKYRHGTQDGVDDVNDVVKEAGGDFKVSLNDSRRILRKIDLFVCVPMCIVYGLQNLDKGTLSYAAVFGLQAQTNLVGTEYSWLTR